MRRLAERGGPVKELQAICGHATLTKVERYNKAADQRALSEAANAKLSRENSLQIVARARHAAQAVVIQGKDFQDG